MYFLRIIIKTNQNTGELMRFITIISLTVLLLSVSVSAFSAEKYAGEEVEEIQRALRTRGYYSGVCDGVYTRELEKAVLSWQKDKGIPETGVCTSYELSILGIEEKTPLENEDKILALASYLYENAKDTPRIYKEKLCQNVLRYSNELPTQPFMFDKECLRCAFESFIVIENGKR